MDCHQKFQRRGCLFYLTVTGCKSEEITGKRCKFFHSPRKEKEHNLWKDLEEGKEKIKCLENYEYEIIKNNERNNKKILFNRLPCKIKDIVYYGSYIRICDTHGSGCNNEHYKSLKETYPSLEEIIKKNSKLVCEWRWHHSSGSEGLYCRYENNIGHICGSELKY